MKTDVELTKICNQIMEGVLTDKPIEMGIQDFKMLYNMLIDHNQRQVPHTLVVNVGDLAYVLFPEWSRQEIIIESKKMITRKDFGFLPEVDWRGTENPSQSFWWYTESCVKRREPVS